MVSEELIGIGIGFALQVDCPGQSLSPPWLREWAPSLTVCCWHAVGGPGGAAKQGRNAMRDVILRTVLRRVDKFMAEIPHGVGSDS